MKTFVLCGIAAMMVAPASRAVQRGSSEQESHAGDRLCRQQRRRVRFHASPTRSWFLDFAPPAAGVPPASSAAVPPPASAAAVPPASAAAPPRSTGSASTILRQHRSRSPAQIVPPANPAQTVPPAGTAAGRNHRSRTGHRHTHHQRRLRRNASESAPGPGGYRLSGTDMTSWAGQRVQVVGTFSLSAAMPAGSTAVGQSGAPSAPPLEFRVQSCSADPRSCPGK